VKSSRVFRTAPFRLALAFSLALAGSITALFAYVYDQTARLEIEVTQDYLELELKEALHLSDERLTEMVQTRLASDFRHNTFEALFDPRGRPTCGNLADLPAKLPIDGTAHRLVVTPTDSANAKPKEAVLVAQRRPDGSVLLIGHDLDYVTALRHVVGVALVRGMIPAAILALLIGGLLAIKTVERIKRMHLTITRINAGDLRERLPISGTGDDLDRLAERINEMLDEIVNLVEEVGSVGDNIAHDLRTPLAAMRARLERARRESDRDALRALITRSLADIDRIHLVVTTMLRVAAIESSRHPPFLAPTRLEDVAEEVLELYEPLAEEQKLDFTLVRGAAAEVAADRDMLIEAVANLVDNAIKFTPPGGAVRIELDQRDGRPLLRVRDSGPGIAPAERSRVTRRYYRAKKGPDVRSNGLGLALVAAIVRLHGFQLDILDVEKGAAVEILFG